MKKQEVCKWIMRSAMLLLFVSCASKKIVSSSNTALIDASARSIIKNHYQNETVFNTLSGKLSVSYSSGTTEQTVPVSFRMEKDKAIWFSAPLGYVKAYITPNSFSFYSKISDEYFDGDFSYLSEFLGTEVDFQMVQRLLLGEAMQDLRKEKYTVSLKEDMYQLEPKKQHKSFDVQYQLAPDHFKVLGMVLSQKKSANVLRVVYPDYQMLDKTLVPASVNIDAVSGNTQHNLVIDYKNLEWNRRLNFPYKVPNGYKRITLN